MTGIGGVGSPSDRLLTLAIETSNPSASQGELRSAIAVGSMIAGDPSSLDVLAIEHVASGGHDDELMPAIVRAMRAASISPVQLDRVAVSIGPGGYTAVRVACATGKMLAEAARSSQGSGRCLCIAVPTALVAAQAALALQPGRLAVALASKGPSVWVSAPLDVPLLPGLAGRALASAAGSVIEADGVPRLVAQGVTTLLADAFLPAAVRQAAERAGLRVYQLSLDAVSALSVSALLGAIDPAELNPFYPREPEAVTLWRMRHGSGTPGSAG